MALNPNEIDDLFKDRFTGLKDHSVNPASQWDSFEQLLSASQAANLTTRGHSSGFFSLKTLSIAASVAALISISVIALESSNKVISVSDLGPTQTKSYNSEEEIEIVSASFLNSIFSYSIPRRSNSAEEATLFTAESSQDLTKAKAKSYELISGTVLFNSIEKEVASTELISQIIYSERPENIDLMSKLSIQESRSMSIESSSREIPEPPYYSVANPSKEFFGKAGVRFGNGESNTSESPNLWSANATASVGFKTFFKKNAGFMVELAYLRRSGNGLERNQGMASSRSYTAFNNSLNASTDNEEIVSSFTIDKSIIADRLDFVQVPLSIFYEYNNKLELNVGVYADFLVRAENQAYIVYNETDYVNREPSKDEINSLSGINRFRYGISAGIDYHVSGNLSLDIRALSPLNSPFKRTNTLESNTNFNRALDLMIGLRYTI